MPDQTLFEKLQITNEKNLLIQGIPSTIEKQFIKLSFAKCVTPLLKVRKIDFALVFAVSMKQLCEILETVIPVLQAEPKLWIAYPKLTSKIASDLNRHCRWAEIDSFGFEVDTQIVIDNTWTAVKFRRAADAPKARKIPVIAPELIALNREDQGVEVPEEVKRLFRKNKPAGVFFESLPLNNRQEYMSWVSSAKQSAAKSRRLDAMVEKLKNGKRNPTAR